MIGRRPLARALSLLFLTGSLGWSGLALAQPGATHAVPGEPVTPRTVRLAGLPAPQHWIGPLKEHTEGIGPVSEAVMEELKMNQPGPHPWELAHFTADPTGAPPAPLAPSVGNGFEGISQGGFIPSEPTVAGGPLNVFSAGNVSVTVTDKDGSNRVETDGQAFFGVPAGEGAISDAVCFYDALRGRFLALCFTQGSAGSTKWSNFYLGISKTNDARGQWWIYKFDQTKDGTTSTGNWSDFEGLGLSDDKLAMSSQQFSFSGNSYKYQKIRVIDRAAAYSGGTVTYQDIVNFAPPPGGDVTDNFVTKVGSNLSAGDNTVYCVCVRYNGGSRVTYRTLTGLPSAPVLSAGNLVPVSTYTPPAGAKQLGSNSTLNTGDCRLSDFFVRNGSIYCAWHSKVTIPGPTADSVVDAIRFLQMRASDHTVLTDETFGAHGIFYYYPSVTVDSLGTVFIGFDRSSASEYSSAYASGKRRNDGSIEPSVLLKAGVAATTQSRWGDYTGIDNDASLAGPSGSSAWSAGQWVKGSNTFGTWINKLTFTYGVVSGNVDADCDSLLATNGDRAPLAGASVALKQGALTLATTTTDGSGNYSFGYLESGTYDVVVTPPAGGVALDAVAGSGGVSQARISAVDVQVNLTNAQTSSGNSFVVAAPHPSPSTLNITPSAKSVGDPAFTMLINGSNFVSCSQVLLDNTLRPTTFVSANQVTAAIPASDMTSPGTHQVQVFNPVAGGNISNAQTFTVSGSVDVTPPTVIVVAPNGGESWSTGSSHAITWTANDNIGVTAVDLAYSVSSGGTWTVIASGLANSGTYNWTVPNVPSTTARVRAIAHDAAGNTAHDSSDADFAIIDQSAPSITVTSPNGGEVWATGSSQAITWTASDNVAVTAVDLELSLDGGGSWTGIAAGLANSGTYPWTLPLTASTQARVRTRAHDAAGNSTVDASDSNFVLRDATSPVVHVTAPNGGEGWVEGSTENITWTASDNMGVDSVNIDYSLHGLPGPWLAAQHGLGNSGAFAWTVPGTPSDSVLVRVTAFDTTGNAAADTSDSLFAILAPAAVADAGRAAVFSLGRPLPNPSRDAVRLRFSLASRGSASLEVLDVAGRRVWFTDAGALGAGGHVVSWNGRSSSGQAASAGIYFVRLRAAGSGTRTVKLIRLP